MTQQSFDIIIVGGGLAGLTSAIHLSKAKFSVLLIEKNSYPKHKVCGEYISNEVLPYLNYLGFSPFNYGAVAINNFELTTHNNKKIKANLPLGGFGLSRFEMDYQLFNLALKNGVKTLQDTVINIQFVNNEFQIETKTNQILKAKIVIGAFGKRSNLDIKFKRKFIKKQAPYLAVKLHVSGNFANNKVALHNFNGGYCGVSKVENNRINLCYITDYKTFKTHKDIAAFQNTVVFKNVALKQLYANSKPEFDTPLTISQISFETKQPIENHIIMCGDTAGMIHPLCGNGMSMAIRSSQLASNLIIDYLNGKIESRLQLEKQYVKQWKINFTKRLKIGHTIAFLFRQKLLAPKLLMLLKWFPFIIPKIIKMTHGKPMKV